MRWQFPLSEKVAFLQRDGEVGFPCQYTLGISCRGAAHCRALGRLAAMFYLSLSIFRIVGRHFEANQLLPGAGTTAIFATALTWAVHTGVPGGARICSHLEVGLQLQPAIRCDAPKSGENMEGFLSFLHEVCGIPAATSRSFATLFQLESCGAVGRWMCLIAMGFKFKVFFREA